jgi:hypothetical protein
MLQRAKNSNKLILFQAYHAFVYIPLTEWKDPGKESAKIY